MSESLINPVQITRRQFAHTVRTRTRLIKDAQEVLAEFGLEATMEQLASHLGVSPTTIYKYFGSKDTLFSEAIIQIWQDWLEWACEEKTPCESLESWVTTIRKFIRARETHPFFGSVLRNVLASPEFLRTTQRGPSEKALTLLAKKGAISSEDLDIKILLWAQAEAGIFSGVHATGELSPTQAENALALSLKLLEISNDKIERFLSKELNLAV
jgi:AcrR family transcriptional regulator